MKELGQLACMTLFFWQLLFYTVKLVRGQAISGITMFLMSLSLSVFVLLTFLVR